LRAKSFQPEGTAPLLWPTTDVPYGSVLPLTTNISRITTSILDTNHCPVVYIKQRFRHYILPPSSGGTVSLYSSRASSESTTDRITLCQVSNTCPAGGVSCEPELHSAFYMLQYGPLTSCTCVPEHSFSSRAAATAHPVRNLRACGPASCLQLQAIVPV
jgi:hypothetical protein